MAMPNLVKIHAWGLLCQWVNFKNFIHVFFTGTHLGQTCRRIFMPDGANNTHSCNGVPFQRFVNIAPHLGSDIISAKISTKRHKNSFLLCL